MPPEPTAVTPRSALALVAASLFGALSGACRPTVDLTPTLAPGTSADVAYTIVRTVRVRLGGRSGESEVTGNRHLALAGAEDWHSEDLTVHESGGPIVLTRDGGVLGIQTWASADGAPLPDAFEGFDGLVDLQRDVTLTPDDTATGATSDCPFDICAEQWLEVPWHAPANPQHVGSTWVHPIAPSDDGEPRFRSWRVLSIADGTAKLESIDHLKTPDADPGDVSFQSRCQVDVPVATGLPTHLRCRDLTRRILATDITATYTWTLP